MGLRGGILHVQGRKSWQMYQWVVCRPGERPQNGPGVGAGPERARKLSGPVGGNMASTRVQVCAVWAVVRAGGMSQGAVCINSV